MLQKTRRRSSIAQQEAEALRQLVAARGQAEALATEVQELKRELQVIPGSGGSGGSGGGILLLSPTVAHTPPPLPGVSKQWHSVSTFFPHSSIPFHSIFSAVVPRFQIIILLF